MTIEKNTTDPRFNMYNKEMIKAWNANMDIQLALDTYAIVTYIVSYMNKEVNLGRISHFIFDTLCLIYFLLVFKLLFSNCLYINNSIP